MSLRNDDTPKNQKKKKKNHRLKKTHRIFFPLLPFIQLQKEHARSLEEQLTDLRQLQDQNRALKDALDEANAMRERTSDDFVTTPLSGNSSSSFANMITSEVKKKALKKKFDKRNLFITNEKVQYF